MNAQTPVTGTLAADSLSRPLTIWCNATLPEPALALLRKGLGSHRLIVSAAKSSNLVAGSADPSLAEADIAVGQPDPRQVVELTRLRWVHLTSAGYTRYDTPAMRQALHERGAILTNSSAVYDEPCANHVLAMMMAIARQLPASWQDQAGRAWQSTGRRVNSRLLTGQTALLYGYGAISRRLTELLSPFRMHLTGVRRQPRGDEPIRVVATGEADALLPTADHVIDILPAADGTEYYFNAARFAAMKPGAIFYNIGRGTTVVQTALIDALTTGHLSAAYLDVTDPEPPPPEDPIWTTPNCHITAHTAGGSADEFLHLAEHFLENLARLTRGEALMDRVF